MSGDSTAMTTAFETISAAATAIALAENRVPQASIRKRRWGGCLSVYWCFGTPRNRKRIGHIVPETTLPGITFPRPEAVQPPPPIILPFIAPPSSPASFLQSEPPSATQSPVGVGLGLVSLTSVSASMYSPGGPASIFAIGPYAHETQLVSPPVFSTFTTEPSTAPYTPPPESVHLTTPSSPEVPFARLLDPKFQRFPIFHNEFQSYHFQPGSPVGQLISPSSGTSSPFPDRGFSSAGGGTHFLEFQTGNPPKLLSLDKLSNFDWGSRLGSGSLTPDTVKSTTTTTTTLGLLDPRYRNREPGVDHRVSFELTTVALAEAVSTSLRDAAKTAQLVDKTADGQECCEALASEPEDALRHQKHRSITLGSSKEFNFDSVEAGNSHKPGVGSDWWANEKVAGSEALGSASASASQDWSFFSIVQPSVS